MSGKEKSSREKPRKRIQTQIHRRKKAKAIYPLTDEWDYSQATPPQKLKRLPKDMPKA